MFDHCWAIACQSLDLLNNISYSVDINYYLLSGGVRVVTDKTTDAIKIITIYDNRVPTAKGIKVGDNADKIISQYGENYYIRTEQETQIIGYVDKDSDICLEFWLGGARVVFYMLDSL